MKASFSVLGASEKGVGEYYIDSGEMFLNLGIIDQKSGRPAPAEESRCVANEYAGDSVDARWLDGKEDGTFACNMLPAGSPDYLTQTRPIPPPAQACFQGITH